MWFKQRAEEVGFHQAVKERDSGAPIAEGGVALKIGNAGGIHPHGPLSAAGPMFTPAHIAVGRDPPAPPCPTGGTA